jgi:hypothetical protein
MLRHPPTFQYNGLTVMLSNPARDDRKELISGTAGYFFEHECLYPQTNRYQCDIRLVDDPSPLLPNTKCILLMGQYAHSKYTQVPTTVDENGGSPIVVRGIPCIPCFAPQDCIDMVNHEERLNPNYKTVAEDLDDDEVLNELLESKGRGKTARSNYRFWAKHYIDKALKICQNGGKIPTHGLQPRYRLWPSAEKVIEVLRGVKGQFFYFDMETDIISADMRCFAFSFSGSPEDVYIVPTLTTDYKPAYDRLAEILAALACAIRDNTIVAHNGAHFDFVILALKYRIAIKNTYDTMVAQNRIFPKVEKSLGHCMSLETFEEYHKNQGAHGYRNSGQAEQLYYYCGKDVFGMYLVHQAQILRAAKDKGLQDSINLAMASIEPYMTASLTGMYYDEPGRVKWLADNDRKMMAQLRVMKSLHGESVKPLISNQKATAYFHDMLGYKVVKVSKKTGDPSLAEDALLKLALLYNNPIIKFLIKYRQTQKASGTLKFKTYRTE